MSLLASRHIHPPIDRAIPRALHQIHVRAVPVIINVTLLDRSGGATGRRIARRIRPPDTECKDSPRPLSPLFRRLS